MLEMNFMMAHGAAASSINLLGKFKLLEILLPAHVSGTFILLFVYVAPSFGFVKRSYV